MSQCQPSRIDASMTFKLNIAIFHKRFGIFDCQKTYFHQSLVNCGFVLFAIVYFLIN